MLPQLNVFVLLVIACVVMPTDFSPAATLLRSPWIPPRIRQILNVESGYNDGLVSPVFAMALAAAVALPTLLAAVDADTLTPDAETQLEENLGEFVAAFLGAVPATLVAIVIGVVFGGLFGLLARLALTRGWAAPAGIRYVMLLAPLLAFGTATVSTIAANGLRRGVRRRHPVPPHAHPRHGGAHDPAHRGDARRRGRHPRRERTALGFIGPRGTATIVFGLLAFAKLPEPEAYDVLAVMVFTVVGSIALHGVLAPQIVRRRMPRAESSAASTDHL